MKKSLFGIEYLKSSLSVNTHLGCPLGCAYCTVEQFAPTSAQLLAEPDVMVKELLSNRLFIPNKTPITVNNRTDPLLPEVKDSTFEVLKILERKGIRNPRVIISKLALRENDLEFLEGLSTGVYFIPTYSDLPSHIERCSHKNQLVSFETLKNRKKVRALHYWRPLIPGFNDSYESIERVLDTVAPSCSGSIISGLRLRPSLANKLSDLGALINEWDGDTQHKYLPPGIVDKITDLRDKKYPNHPLFRHTSCGINYLNKSSDYNFHFLVKGACLPNCPNSNLCNVGEKPSEEEVSSLMNSLGIFEDWEYKGDKIYVNGEISEEERSCLTHSLNYLVRSQSVSRSPSERVLVK